MEELLNKLIEKGWKVFWVEPKWRNVVLTKRTDCRIHISYFDKTIWRTWWRDFSLRELVSKESWLWQFVCENGMIYDEHYCWDWYIHWDDNWRIEIRQRDYRYRLIESALCDEDKLEDFILDNIKID